MQSIYINQGLAIPIFRVLLSSYKKLKGNKYHAFQKKKKNAATKKMLLFFHGWSGGQP